MELDSIDEEHLKKGSSKKTKAGNPLNEKVEEEEDTPVTVDLDEPEDDEWDDENLEDDKIFAAAASRKTQGPSKKNKMKAFGNISNEICSHFRKGLCRHGFLGKKPFDKIPHCMWTHPRICEKLFYNGHDPEKGCKGKSMG